MSKQDELHGIPVDRLVLALVLFSAYPLAWLFQTQIRVAPRHTPSSSLATEQALRNVRWRHGFSLVVSLPLMALGFPVSLVLQCLGMCLLVWTGTRMVQSIPAFRQYVSWWPPAVFVGLLSFLALHHIQHQWWGFQPDLTAPIMVLVQKLSFYAWAMYDRSVTSMNSNSVGHKKADGDETTVPGSSTMVHELWGDSILELLGYCFFFPGWYVGPVLEFQEYCQFIQQTGPFSPRLDRPNLVWPSIRVFLTGMTCLALYFNLNTQWSFFELIKADYIARTGFATRCVHLLVAGFIARCKYYSVWKLAEGANILAGVVGHHTNPDGTISWDYAIAQNANIFRLEGAQTPRDFINFWNMKTSIWLRKTVYNRLMDHGQGASMAVVASYFASAVWHGFYSGYYLTFMSAAMVTMTGQAVRRRFRSVVLPYPALKRVYDILGWILTHIFCNYVCAPFPLMTLESGVQIWQSLYFVTHVGCGLVLVLDRVAPGRKSSKAKLRQGNVKAPNEMQFSSSTRNGEDIKVFSTGDDARGDVHSEARKKVE